MRRVVAALLGLALVLGGCASTRTKALSLSLTTANTATDAFNAYDARHQAEIVVDAQTYEAGIEALASYYDRREPVEHARDLAYSLIAAAALDSGASLEEVLAAVQRFARAVQAIRGDL